MSYLQQYRLKLKTLSPLFIGSGASLTKKEYLFIPQTNEVIFVDLHKLLNMLDLKGISGAYEDFINGNEKDLFQWFKHRRLISSEIRSLKSYVINAGNAFSTSKGFDLTGIQLFIKDSMNCPYIPGSSLKGAIHTAILACTAENSDYSEGLIDLRNTYNKALERESEKIEAEFLHTLRLKKSSGENIPKSNAVNSIMKGIGISDSLPLAQKSLTLCAKVDYGIKGIREKKGQDHSYTTRECIRPGVTAEHILTLDTRILEKARMNVDTILNSIRHFYDLQNKYFISKFSRSSEFDNTLSNGYELYLGGGAGFVSKTVLYPILKEKGLKFTAQLLQKQFPNGYHGGDIEKGVSPHMLKCTKYDGKIYMMGRCEVSIT